MELDDDKPFECSQNGCGQKFTNEDHLSVHMKKHEMSLALNLASGGGGILTGRSPNSLGPPGLFLDQTPTPTKFLRNCEEIGLFQELKNPFEEAFKKAMDSEGHPIEHTVPGVAPFPDSATNELNTPIPHIPKTVDEIKMEPHDPDTDNLVALNLTKSPQIFSSQSSDSAKNDDVSIVSVTTNNQNTDPQQQPNSPAPAAPSSSTSPSLMVTAAQSTTLSPPKTTMPAASPVIQQPQYATCMQVFLQLPSGQTIPVQIPATITTPNAPQVVPPTTNATVNQGLLQKINRSTISNLVVPQAPQQPAQQPQAQQTQTQSATPTQSILLQSPVKQPVQQTATTPQGKTSFTKQRLKAALQQVSPSQGTSKVLQVSPEVNNLNQITVISSTTNPVPSTSPMETSSIASDSASSPDTDYGGGFKRIKKMEDDPDDRRKKFLERNRAAAARCRQKRKHWITNLEQKGDELQMVNNRLQNDINLLKTEVAQLKTLLLAHKDCPITQQQKSMGQFPVQAFSVMDAMTTDSMETCSVVVNDTDNKLVSISGTNWVSQPTVIKTVAPITTATVTTVTGQQKTITIIPKVIKTESPKPVQKK